MGQEDDDVVTDCNDNLFFLFVFFSFHELFRQPWRDDSCLARQLDRKGINESLCLCCKVQEAADAADGGCWSGQQLPLLAGVCHHGDEVRDDKLRSQMKQIRFNISRHSWVT